MEAEILAQATGCQEFVQGLLLIALVSAPVQPKEATRPKGVGKGDGGQPEQPQQKLQRAWCFKKIKALDPTQTPPRPEPDLPYSSRMILRTLLTMLPTVVSEGCAVVILLPSRRINSISSPATHEGQDERGRRTGRPGVGGESQLQKGKEAKQREAGSAAPALLQRWSVMSRRSSPRVSRAMSSELRCPPPRFRVSTKPSILPDNSEPFAAALGIFTTIPQPAETSTSKPQRFTSGAREVDFRAGRHA